MKKIGISTFIILMMISGAFAQKNALDNDILKSYKTGQEFFDYNLYGPSRQMHNDFIYIVQPATENDFSNLKDEALVEYAISGLRADMMSGENELITVINNKYPNPVTIPAILELGSYYYNKKWYAKCIETYSMIDLEDLSEYDMTEASFKKGYSLFVTKEFVAARMEFERIRKIKNEFYYPGNYYFGLCEYFSGNYTSAVNTFTIVENNNDYKSFVPYYITQIYFAQDKPEKVIEHGELALRNPQLRNRTEIRQLIGQSYFKQGKYEQALPHLEYYEQNTDKLTIEEFYQLGFTQYKLNKYNDAISNFRELSALDSRIGQISGYYLADCYYRTGDNLSARAAFKKVSQMDYDKGMKDEALFNYGKLSAESGYEREAINTLIKIDKTNKNYDSAQEILSTLLENTSDYVNGIEIIENMSDPTGRVKTAYQNLAMKYAIQQYNNNEKDEALKYFTKSYKYENSRITASQGAYWSALIYHERNDYTRSSQMIDKYNGLSQGITWMPDESTQAMAYYIQGYNYFQQKQYGSAGAQFASANRLIKDNAGKIKNIQILNRVWPDALVRSGDCQFSAGQYQQALPYYTQAAEMKKGSYAYAMYQRGMILGLMGEPYEKILTLRDLKTNSPDSEYADKALLQLGDTYAEVENFDNAYRSYQELANNYKNSPLVIPALLKSGLIAYNRGDLNTAIRHYKSVFDNNPSPKDAESALLGLQEIYINDLGQSEDYVDFLNQQPGYQVNQSTADSLAFMVGISRYNEGEYDKAVAGFNNYLDKYPNGANQLKASYYRGESHSVLKDYDRALMDYERTIAFGTSELYVSSLKKAALISYNYSQDFSKAYKYYDLYYNNVNDLDEKYQSALNALRSAFRTTNSEGIKTYSPIVTSNEKATTDEKATAYYYLAKTYVREGSLDNAILAFEKVAALSNNNQAAEARYSIAEILYNQGKKEEAEEQCNKANEANSAYPYWIAKSLLLLSDIYYDRADLFNARAALEAIIENFKDDELSSAAKEKLAKVEVAEKDKSRIKPSSSSDDILELMDSTNKN